MNDRPTFTKVMSAVRVGVMGAAMFGMLAAVFVFGQRHAIAARWRLAAKMSDDRLADLIAGEGGPWVHGSARIADAVRAAVAADPSIVGMELRPCKLGSRHCSSGWQVRS